MISNLNKVKNYHYFGKPYKIQTNYYDYIQIVHMIFIK